MMDAHIPTVVLECYVVIHSVFFHKIIARVIACTACVECLFDRVVITCCNLHALCPVCVCMSLGLPEAVTHLSVNQLYHRTCLGSPEHGEQSKQSRRSSAPCMIPACGKCVYIYHMG
jgi:hypothetical protein